MTDWTPDVLRVWRATNRITECQGDNVHLTATHQHIMDRALLRSVRIISNPEPERVVTPVVSSPLKLAAPVFLTNRPAPHLFAGEDA